MRQYYTQLRKTDFAPRIGKPLWSVLSVMQDKLRKSEDLSYDSDSRESKLFGFAFYSNAIRKEFANEKVRSTLVALSGTKYYKHKVKQLAKEVQRDIAQWDSDIARATGTEILEERYDRLLEVATQELDYLYKPFLFSVTQVLTSAGCKESYLIASLICSMALLEYSNRQLCSDVGERIMECPVLDKLSAMFAEKTQVTLQKVINELNKQINSQVGDVNVNADKNVTLAAENLFNNLQSFNRMREIISKTFEMNEEQEKQNLNEAEIQN